METAKPRAPCFPPAYGSRKPFILQGGLPCLAFWTCTSRDPNVPALVFGQSGTQNVLPGECAKNRHTFICHLSVQYADRTTLTLGGQPVWATLGNWTCLLAFLVDHIGVAPNVEPTHIATPSSSTHDGWSLSGRTSTNEHLSHRHVRSLKSTMAQY